MAISIFPPQINAFPEDVVDFRLSIDASPVTYHFLNNFTTQVQSTILIYQDFSGPTGGGSARTVQRGRGGVISAEWLFLANMVPTGAPGYVAFGLYEQYFISPALQVKVYHNRFELIDEGGAVLQTTSFTPLEGHRWKIVASGNGFQAFLNDVFVGGYNAAAPVKYPMYAVVEWNKPFVGVNTFIVGAPILSGDWRYIADDDAGILFDGNWDVVGAIGGTYDDATDKGKVKFTCGQIPGPFRIRVIIDGQTAHQFAEALLVIEPLSIESESAVTVLPGAIREFKTNYDAAQKKLVSWVIVSGGGSVSSLGVFTAPTAPGNTTLRAFYSQQRSEVVITVPPVISSTQPAAMPSETITLTTNIPGATWTTDIGSILGSGASVSFVAPATSGVEAIVTATGGGFVAQIKIPIAKKFPYDPSEPIKWNVKRTVLISTSEDRTRVSRIKDKDGDLFEAFELGFNNRDTTEFNAVKAFFKEHYPGKKFIMTHPITGVRLVFYFDSELAVEADATCSIDYSFRVTQ